MVLISTKTHLSSEKKPLVTCKLMKCQYSKVTENLKNHVRIHLYGFFRLKCSDGQIRANIAHCSPVISLMESLNKMLISEPKLLTSNGRAPVLHCPGQLL